MNITGIVNQFLEPNTDTDVIIPARFLKRTSLDGFEQFAFFEKRYHPDTICEPTIEAKDFVFKHQQLNSDCTLNHSNSKDATFLLTWFNFGCGSSREHAVYALNNYKVIIGSAPAGKTAFADIFRENCRQNLIRTPVITSTNHERLAVFIKENIISKQITLGLDTEKKVIYVEGNDNFPEIPYDLPDNHEEYIQKGETPFEMARKSINENLVSIDEWNQCNQKVIDHYPSSK